MTAPGNNLLQVALALAFVIASGYASGRIHQWYKHGLERDQAYREGYNQASRSMFDMAIRSRAGKPLAAATPPVPVQHTPRQATESSRWRLFTSSGDAVARRRS